MTFRMSTKKIWITGIISAVLVGVLVMVLATQYASAAFISTQQPTSQARNWQGALQWNRGTYRPFYDANTSMLMDRLRIRQCLENATFKVEDVSITGKFTDAEYGFIVMSVDGSSLVFRAPNRWVINGEVKSFIHLFVDDIIVKGHEVRVDALRVTVTLQDGRTITHYVAKTVTDLNTGASAQALMPTTLGGSPYSSLG